MKALGSISDTMSDSHRHLMEETVGKGICPFCHIDPNVTVVIHEGEHWLLWHNPFPYAGLKPHLLIASRAHVTSVAEVTPEMSAELFSHIQWAVQEFKIEGGGLLMRFGDPTFHGGSISHLHLHIEAPDKTVPVDQIFYKRRPS